MSTQWRLIRHDKTEGDWAGAVIRVRDDGEVILESGAPMTDGRLAIMVWKAVQPEHVAHTTGGSAYYDGPGTHYYGYLRTFEGRHYAHTNDEGGLADAQAVYGGEQS